MSRSQKPRGQREGSFTRSLRGGLSCDLEAHAANERAPLHGLRLLPWASASRGLGSSCARPTGGSACLEDLNVLCWRGGQLLSPGLIFILIESGLVHVAKFSKSNRCLKTCEVSDKTLDFQFLTKPLQFLPGSQGHVPCRGEVPTVIPCLTAGFATLRGPVYSGGGAWPGLNLRRKPLPRGSKNRLKVTRNSSPGG